jgi:large subunit ribosomal protein L1
MNEFLSALQELRKTSKKRNFEQSIDLIINLKDFDIKKQNINTSIELPFQIKESKICAFLENDNDAFDFVIIKDQFSQIKPDQIKKLAGEYDFFVSLASLMPSVATVFGRILGPAGKMPNPKTGGVIPDEKKSAEVVQKLKKTIVLRTKDASIKTLIGRESMKDEQLAQNSALVLSTILNVLPNRKENIRSVMLKLTMSKPVKVKI